MAAAKVPTIKTANGRHTWKLGKFGMTSHYGTGADKSQRAVSREEVFKMLNSSITQTFNAAETYNQQFYPRIGAFTFRVHNDGSVSFGCQDFSKTATKQLKKWAGVR